MSEYYLKNVSALPDPAFDRAALRGIPDWRIEYILKYRNAGDRKLSLGAWQLLAETLKKRGFSADNVKVGENGKLFCEGAHFNISHSGEMVLCAMADAPVGCDIERVTGAHFEIMKRVFSTREREYILEPQDAEDKNRRFFRLWTMKESYLKMTGEGLSLPPRSIEIIPETNTVLRHGTEVRCRLINKKYNDYEISICEDTLSA